MPTGCFTIRMRLIALLALAALLSACTKQVPRAPVETRHYAVEWESLDRQLLELDGIHVDGIPLTPTQWPLEASMKSLFQGDFTGVIDRFDLRFHSSTLEEDVLEDLFSEGYVPVFLRITNLNSGAADFFPERLVLNLDGASALRPVSSRELPDAFKKMDWAKTGISVAVAALVVVVLILAAASGRDSGNMDVGNVAVRITGEAVARTPELGDRAAGSRSGQGDAAQLAGHADTTGLIEFAKLLPGESMEGFLFFRVDQTVLDWSTAKLQSIGGN